MTAKKGEDSSGEQGVCPVCKWAGDPVKRCPKCGNRVRVVEAKATPKRRKKEEVTE